MPNPEPDPEPYPLRPAHSVGAIIVTPDHRFLLQRRDHVPHIWYPGAWGLFGGGIDPGESERDALRRELQEEMAIAGAGAVELFRHHYEGTDDRSWSAIFAITWDGPVVPQAAEIAWHGWEPVARVLRRAEEPTFVPDGREVLNRWLDEGARLPPGTLGSPR